jgi:diguanylate cyclase (GGDEF)-like protein
MRYDPKSIFRSFATRAKGGGSAVPEKGRPRPDRSEAGASKLLRFLSRRFVVGSIVALGILVANALVSYRTITNLIDASHIVERTLKVVEALKDIKDSVVNSETELRGYIISGEGDRLARTRAFLQSVKESVQTLLVLSEATPDQLRQIEQLDALVAEELQRFDELIETHRQKGVSAAIRSIGATANTARIGSVQLLTAELRGAADARLVRRTEQFKRSSDISVITAAVATLLNISLLSVVILLARREIRERRQTEEVIKFAANHDPLTGLPNRSLLAERAARALDEAKSQGGGLALLFIDLDRFKNINDTFGHGAGDRLLQNVAVRLARCVPRSETVARHGGDEFVVLIKTFDGSGDLAQVAGSILAAVAKPMAMYGKEFEITASVGISISPVDGEDLWTLLKNADIAMYRAKQLGNSHQFYSEGMNLYSVERLELETALRRALERNELSLHYQPKVEARTERITGIECLLRWQHPTLGPVPADQVVPLAEETGLIVPIGRWALLTACHQARSLAELGLHPVRMAVNLSARQFMSPALLDDVADALAETRIDPRWLEFEITESVMIREPERAVKLLRDLKAFGVALTIDDFGTGYSSLAYLKRLPIDGVKIDASFVRGIPVDASDVAITETILAMSRRLGLKVVAEGVETRDQLRFLEVRGCDELQGYYFSKPLPAEQLIAYLRERQAVFEEAGIRTWSGGLRAIARGGDRREVK